VTSEIDSSEEQLPKVLCDLLLKRVLAHLAFPGFSRPGRWVSLIQATTAAEKAMLVLRGKLASKIAAARTIFCEMQTWH